MPPTYSTDRRLDILVLGPMGEAGLDPSTVRIRDAVIALLAEPPLAALLAQHRVLSTAVHVPQGQNQAEIVQNILGLLDTADLCLFDLTPKATNPDRANVFYELALVHALGIPSHVLIQEGYRAPFYANTTVQNRVQDFEPATLVEALRAPLLEFLDLENRRYDFTNDRVTQFYGLPIVDISAAVGLAIGYYYNFLSRLITEGGFIAHRPDLIRQVVYVRPSSVDSTYEADMAVLKARIAAAGLAPATEKLPAIPADDKGPLWFDHVDGIVVDIPRTVYPLRRSPRLLSLQGRNQRFASPAAERSFEQRYGLLQANLLDRVEEAIRYQMRHDGPRVRQRMVHFTDLDNAAEQVARLRG